MKPSICKSDLSAKFANKPVESTHKGILGAEEQTQLPPPPQYPAVINEEDFDLYLCHPEKIQNDSFIRPPMQPKDKLTPRQASQVVSMYATQYGLTPSEALNSIAFWVQDAGYIKKVPNRSQAINHHNKLQQL